jgi:hypothetical protein
LNSDGCEHELNESESTLISSSDVDPNETKPSKFKQITGNILDKLKTMQRFNYS